MQTAAAHGSAQLRRAAAAAPPPSSELAAGRRLVCRPARRSSSRVCAYQRRDEVADIISIAKARINRKQQGGGGDAGPSGSSAAAGAAPAVGPVGDFVRKLHLAWRVFFPEPPRVLTPKEEGKQRLRMILVADRVGMNEVTMEAMRERIIGAVSPYVEIEAPELVEVAMTTDADLGAIYSVAVPVRRVRAAARVPLNADGDITVHWDPSDDDSDPSSQFPFGT